MTLKEITKCPATIEAWENMVADSVKRAGHDDPDIAARSAVRGIFLALNSRQIVNGKDEVAGLIKQLGTMQED